MVKEKISKYAIHLGDSTLILGHRLGEWCGHGPALELDIALTNTSLDLLGQTRNYFQFAAIGSDIYKDEDQIAFLRYEHEYTNIILVEQPNGNFAQTITRQFLFDIYHQLLLRELQFSKEKGLTDIAAKSIKEVNYHVEFSSEWILRLGDGTAESHQKMQDALNLLWPYYKELFTPSELETEMKEAGIGVDIKSLESTYLERVKTQFDKATLEIPESKWPKSGGKQGNHSEHFGFILTELQYMQRTYPNMQW